MSDVITYLSLDFGSEYIRVAKTSYHPEQPTVITPKIVEFNGRPYLRNALLFSTDGSAIEEVGEDALLAALNANTPELLHRHSALEAGSSSEVGKGADHLLAYIRRVSGLADVAEEANGDWQILIALPIASRPDTADLLIRHLQQAGFPAPKALDSAQAILATADSPPGLYLVVDCGATQTRLALCQVDDQRRYLVRATKAGQPGGNSFDQALTDHFSQKLADSTLLSPSRLLELDSFIEEFKIQFAHAWRENKDEYEALYPIPSSQEVIRLQRSDFESSTVAGERVKQFRSLAQNWMETKQVKPADLNGVFLVGGGAQWPFVRTWAEEFAGKERVHASQFPAQDIVCSLPHLAIIQKPTMSLAPPLPEHVIPILTEPPQSRPSHLSYLPLRALLLELGGLIGFMGFGWFFELQSMPIGCLALLGWWVFLGSMVATLIVLSTAIFNPLPLLVMLPFWLLVPVLSGVLAYREAVRRNRGV